MTLADNPYEAFGHLCSWAAGKKPDADATGATVLLLSDPDKLESVSDVVTLVERYVPACVCWTFDAGGRRALRAVTPADIQRWSQSATGEASPSRPQVVVRPMASRDDLRAGRGSPAPRLRLAGHGELPPLPDEPTPFVEKAGDSQSGQAGASGGSTGRPGQQPTHLVSEEELAMLLEKTPLPDQPPNIRGVGND